MLGELDRLGETAPAQLGFEPLGGLLQLLLELSMCLNDFLHTLLGLRIIGVQVGVHLKHRAPKRSLDRLRARQVFELEDLERSLDTEHELPPSVRYLFIATAPPGEEELRDFEARSYGLQPTCDPRLWLGEHPHRVATTGFLCARLVRPLVARTYAGLLRQARRRADDAPSYRMEIWPDKKGQRRLQRRMAETLGSILWGRPEPRQPEEHVVWVRGRGIQFLGQLEERVKNRFAHLQTRPYRNSQSLPDRLARVAINLGRRPGEKTWDPMCGTGTLLLHGAAQDLPMLGSDSNRKLCHMARANLHALQLRAHVVHANALQPCLVADRIVTDFPYRLMTHWPEGEELRILTALQGAARRFVLIHSEPLTPILAGLGFRIRCEGVFRKGGLKRHLVLANAPG